jgi:hypothetical protein
LEEATGERAAVVIMSTGPTSTREKQLWPLLDWRYEQTRPFNGENLAYQLTVDRCPDTPEGLTAALRLFRKLRQDQRVQLCTKFVWWAFNKPPKDWKAKKPNGAWRCSTHKAKYTYPCPLCLGHWT